MPSNISCSSLRTNAGDHALGQLESADVLSRRSGEDRVSDLVDASGHGSGSFFHSGGGEQEPTEPGGGAVQALGRLTMSPMSDGLNFKLTEEQEMFRKSVREVCEDKIVPRAAEIDEADEYPWDIDELLVKNGFTGVSYPEEYGGAGGGPVELCLLIEEISRVLAPASSLIPAVNKLGAIPILLAGTDEQKKMICSGITDGIHRMSYCLTEPGSGSDAAAMKSKAVQGRQRLGHHRDPSGSSRGPAHPTCTRTSRYRSRGAEGQEHHRPSSSTRTWRASRLVARKTRWASAAHLHGEVILDRCEFRPRT